MKVFIVGEGKNDIGDLSKHPAYREGRDGYFQPLLRTMLGNDQIEFDGGKITLIGTDKSKTGAKAARKKAAIAAAMVSAVEADLFVYCADGDNDFKRTREKRAMELADADIPWAIAMPKETVEAWVLGDEASINEVTDAATPPSKPEALWGAKQDPTSNHPKQVLTRLVGERLSTEGFARAGSVALPSRLCVSCPESFRPFSKEVADFSGLPPCTP